MDDLISRQAVIDALEKVAELFPWRVPGNRDTYDRYNEAWNDAIGRAEIEIEELPSALAERTAFKHDVYDAPTIEPEPHWIPCSERLPEESGLYIVTNVGRWVEQVGTRYYNIRTDGGFWSGHPGNKVLAWMELPAPYKEGAE